MKGLKIALIILLGMTLAIQASAQSAKLKRANKSYEQLNYMEAIQLYTEVLEGSDVAEAKIKLADCYRKVSNTIEAEYWYGQVIRLPEAEPIHKLYYGMALHTNGKCDLAQEWFDKYIAESPDDLRGQYLSKACTYEEELMSKNAGIYEVKHMPFNTALDDFSPMFFKDGVVFTSEYNKAGPVLREHTWTGDPFTELFFVNAQEVNKENYEFQYGKRHTFSNRINSKYHDATAFFTEGEKSLFFTRNNLFKGKVGKDDANTVRLKVFSAESGDGGSSWNNLTSLPFNSDEYSVAHPTLTPDGKKLYFASDMPGGFGGMDLYVSEEENGRWSPPTNLGASINTEGNEIFPYFSKDNKLYFASDGHIGLGGLDIYFMESTNGEWGQITNIGYPLNSRSDDFGICFNEENTFGYFTSDREGGAGDDDIYSFVRKAATVQIYVFDEASKQPIEGAKVTNNCNKTELVTNAKGFATLEMKLNECCNYEAAKEPYQNNSKEGCTKEVKNGDKVVVEIPLKKEEKPVIATTPETPANASGEFDITGVIYDKLTRKPIEGAEVTLTNDCNDNLATPVVTDASGKYFFKLNKDCCYTVKATKVGFLASSVGNQCTRNLTKPTSLKADLDLQKYIKEAGDPDFPVITGTTPTTTDGPQVSHGFKNVEGAIPFLLHIYYDFDQSYIRDDATTELEKLYQIMVDNPELVVEIGSHTDSRGSYTYNDRLSQRRAESVVRWLRAKGIPKARLKNKGYGETINVNQCANNVPCSEDEHQWNRRTEFKVIGYYNSEGQYVEVESKKPDAVKVDPCQGCPF